MFDKTLLLMVGIIRRTFLNVNEIFTKDICQRHLYRDGKRQENGEALSPGPTFKEIPASHQRPGYPSYDKKSDDYAA
jgi:hypothetical protein